MSDFDPDVWKQRAWARFCRATRRLSARDKKRQAVLELTWAKDVMSISDLASLVEWCGTRCIRVEFAKKPLGSYSTAEKVMTISSRLSPLGQVVVLLHECGHHLCGGADHHDRFGMGYPQTEPAVKRTFHHRMSCLEEEIEAWHRGWKLAVRLGLNVSREDFDKVRLDCLKSYVRWTLQPETMEKE